MAVRKARGFGVPKVLVTIKMLPNQLYNTRRMVNEVALLFAARAKQKGLALNVEVTDDLTDEIVGDELRIRQILSNFVGNAVKFTETGAVTVQVGSVQPESASDVDALRQRFGVPSDYRVTWIRLAVSDTGIGIPAHKQAVIFDAFTQADGSATRRHGGSGLGLTIARNLAQMMGGSIGVQSEEGKGSTFWVILPLFALDMEQPSGAVNSNLPAKEEEDSLPTMPSPRGCVLLVEDNAVNRKVAVSLLQRLGYEVDVAADGVEAVEKTAQRRYDAVLMDVHMPCMNGLEATRRIREREQGTGEHQVIIALTASAMKEDVRECITSGMDDYLSKPVKLEVLREMLEKWQDPSLVEIASQPPLDHKFLAEMTGGDEEFTRELLEEFLKTVPPLMQQVEQALHTGDREALARAAHTMKGSSRAIGAQPFSEIALALERAGKEGRMDDALCAAEKLFAEWERVRRHIERTLMQKAA